MRAISFFLQMVRDFVIAVMVLAAVIAFITLCSGCGYGSAWHRLEVKAWKKDGACSVACDYHQGNMSTAITLDSYTCRCYTPEIRARNDARSAAGLPSYESAGAEYTFPTGVVYEALRICAHQHWRCPEDLPLPGAL